MLISGMNHFFERHGRWVLLVLTIALSLTFISFFTSGSFLGGPDNSEARAIATVNGRTVNVAEYRKHNIEMSMATPRLLSDFARFSQNAIGIAAYECALNEGIRVTDDEMARYLTELFPNEKGGFDKAAYSQYLKNYVYSRGISPGQFDDAVRKFLTIEKLYSGVATDVNTPSLFVEHFATLMHTQYVAEIMWFRSSSYLKDVIVSDTQVSNEYRNKVASYIRARAEYNSLTDSMNRFPEPKTVEESKARKELSNRQTQALAQLETAEKSAPMTDPVYDVTAIFIPFANDTIRAGIQLTDAEIRAYYDANPSQFVGTDSNSFETMKSMVKEVLLSERVKMLIKQEAAAFANTAAFETMNEMTPEVRLSTFKEAAAQHHFRVVESNNFSKTTSNFNGVGYATGLLPSLEAATERNYFVTDVAESYNGAFVALIKNVTPARLKTIEEATTAIRTQLKREAADQLASAAARAFSGETKAFLATGKTIDKLPNAKFETLEPFSVDSMPQQPMYQSIAMHATMTKKGTVSDPFQVDGSYAVIYMKDIKAPAADKIASDLEAKRMMDVTAKRAAVLELLYDLNTNVLDRAQNADNAE